MFIFIPNVGGHFLSRWLWIPPSEIWGTPGKPTSQLGLWSSRSGRLDRLRLVRQAHGPHGGVTDIGKSPLESTSQCNDPKIWEKSGKTVVNGWWMVGSGYVSQSIFGLNDPSFFVTFQLCCCLKHLKGGLSHGYSFFAQMDEWVWLKDIKRLPHAVPANKESTLVPSGELT